jgi:hypothetical protein
MNQTRIETAQAYVKDRLRWIQSSHRSTAREIRNYTQRLPELKKALHNLRMAYGGMEQHYPKALEIRNAVGSAITVAQKELDKVKHSLERCIQQVKDMKTEAHLLVLGLRQLKGTVLVMPKDEIVKQAKNTAERLIQVKAALQEKIDSGKLQPLSQIKAELLKNAEEVVQSMEKLFGRGKK